MTNTIANPDRVKPGKGMATPNRSLERGISVLRAFRAGSSMLGNSEISDRTGLSRSTVSRLTQSLVESGMLEYVPQFRAYRLGVPVLSMAHAMCDGSTVLRVATPLMTEVATRHKLNVGLAVADDDDMVYLESFRYSRRQSLRTIVSGLRIPIALTSLGRAYLATLSETNFDITMREMASRNPGRAWLSIRKEIELAVQSVRQNGYCVASWQPQVVAVATPMQIEGYGTYVLNVSISTQQTVEEVEAALAKPLLSLAASILAAVHRIE